MWLLMYSFSHPTRKYASDLGFIHSSNCKAWGLYNRDLTSVCFRCGNVRIIEEGLP